MATQRQTGVRLGAQELAAWRGFLRVQSSLFRELDAELTAAHDLPLRSYEVLLLLEDAPQRRLRMSDLSRSVLLSPSGVTRLVDRLQREGLVDRERCPEDGRGYFAVLSDAGERGCRRRAPRTSPACGGCSSTGWAPTTCGGSRPTGTSWSRAPPAPTPSGAGPGRARPRRAARPTMPDVIVVGAGLAGLCCARELRAAGLEVLVLERSDAPGGRVRTDEVDGFLLDRGFQVLLTAYPEARRVLDYDRLALRPFESGALIRRDGRFARLADPAASPAQGARVAARGAGQRPGQAARRAPAPAAVTLLAERAAHRAAGHHRGGAAARGLLERPRRRLLPPVPGRHLPRPLARDLEPPVRLRLQAVRGGRGGAAGRRHAGDPAPAGGGPARGGRALRRHGGVGGAGRGRRSPAASGSTARGRRRRRGRAGGGPAHRRRRGAGAPRGDHPALRRRALARRRAGARAERRAPRARSTTSACPATWRRATRRRGRRWSRPPCSASRRSRTRRSTPPSASSSAAGSARRWTGWRLLRVLRIPFALPAQPPAALSPAERPVRLHDGLFVCGDHRDTASIQGAMVSGRRAAAAVRGLDAAPVCAL